MRPSVADLRLWSFGVGMLLLVWTGFGEQKSDPAAEALFHRCRGHLQALRSLGVEYTYEVSLTDETRLGMEKSRAVLEEILRTPGDADVEAMLRKDLGALDGESVKRYFERFGSKSYTNTFNRERRRRFWMTHDPEADAMFSMTELVFFNDDLFRCVKYANGNLIAGYLGPRSSYYPHQTLPPFAGQYAAFKLEANPIDQFLLSKPDSVEAGPISTKEENAGLRMVRVIRSFQQPTIEGGGILFKEIWEAKFDLKHDGRIVNITKAVEAHYPTGQVREPVLQFDLVVTSYVEAGGLQYPAAYTALYYGMNYKLPADRTLHALTPRALVDLGLRSDVETYVEKVVLFTATRIRVNEAMSEADFAVVFPAGFGYYDEFIGAVVSGGDPEKVLNDALRSIPAKAVASASDRDGARKPLNLRVRSELGGWRLVGFSCVGLLLGSLSGPLFAITSTRLRSRRKR